MLTTRKDASKYFYLFLVLQKKRIDVEEIYFVSCIRFESGKDNKIQDTSRGGPPTS
jgi:hypothetical protein